MTVSSPCVFAASFSTTTFLPKPSVTVSETPDDDVPAPSPQPATVVASAARASSLLANEEHDPVAGPVELRIDVAGAVDGAQVEHIAAVAERLGQQVGPVGLRPDREPRPVPGPACRPHEAQLRAAEPRAASAVVARQAQLDVLEPRGIGIGRA